MNKRLTVLLAFMSLFFSGIKAQNDSIKAYLLTCEPGKAIYELFGHTAVWIEDIGNGTDAVFNYGQFDFNTPHFIWRFSLGQTDYILGATSLKSFLTEYRIRGSEVYAQQLNLTIEESRKLYSLLIENCRPENRVYRYNYLYNNCATMALDKIEQSINGSVNYHSHHSAGTFRDIFTEHTSRRPWSQFAIDFVTGSEIDEPLGYRQEAFAPLYLKELAQDATITDSAGTERPLVLPYIKLANPNHAVDFGNPAFTPIRITWMVFMTVLLFSLLGWYKEKPFRLIDILVFGIQGVAGIIIALLFFFSEHPAVDTNWLVICFNPLPLVFIPFMLRQIGKGKLSVFVICEFVVCTVFLILSPVIPQKIEPATLLLIATFALRALSTSVYQLSAKHRSKSGNGIMTGRFILLVLAACFSLPVEAKQEKRPKLVVGIVLDQFDRQTLEMMLPSLRNDGIKLMWYNGYSNDCVMYDFDETDRASAIASIYTGASPFQHGIVAGKWMNRKTLMVSSPLDDGNRNGINTIEHTSPQKLLATNLADEMKLESEGRSRVCAIAIERDASVLAAGHEADVAIWMNHENGEWCSSDYYGSLPAWVEGLNDNQSRKYEWQPLSAADDYIRISGKDNAYTFSHTVKIDNPTDWITSPASNDMVNRAAIEAIDAMKLGGDDTPDLLALTYYAGNFRNEPYSINSLEQQDILLRLDCNIAELVNAINAKVGWGNTLFFITSTGYTDYKVPDLANTRIPSGTISMERTVALLNLYLSAKLGSDKYIDTYYRNHIYLNHNLIEDKGISIGEILGHCVDLLVQVSGVKSILLLRDLMASTPDTETTRKRNALHNASSGDILIEAAPGWGISDENEGLTYYRQPASQPFPLIIYGNRIHAEISHEPLSVSVLIPTICNLIHCDIPNASYARPLTGLK